MYIIYSPSVDIDHTWQPAKGYIAKEIKQHVIYNIYVDSCEPDELETLMDKQHNVIRYLKSHSSTKTIRILACIYDFADDPSFTQNSKLS